MTLARRGGGSLVAIAIAALSTAACTDRATPPPPSDSGVRPRVLEPPPTRVRAVPPHNVHSNGVGPYELGQKLTDVLGLLPRGPRVELYRLDKLASYSLVRDQDGVQIGVDRDTGVRFVVAVAPEIAKAEQGVGVGATLAELEAALGAPSLSLSHARDPRLVEFEKPAHVKFFLARDRVEAIVVSTPLSSRDLAPPPAVPITTDPAQPTNEPADPAPDCSAAYADADVDEITAAARFRGDAVRVVTACFAKKSRQALVQQRNRLAIVGGESGKRRRVATASFPGMVFAAPLDIDGDGRAEIAVVRRSETAKALTLRLSVHRLDGSRLTEVYSGSLYQLEANALSWAGSRLSGTDVVVELASGGGELRARGFLIERRDGRIRLMLPLEPVRRRIAEVKRPPQDGPRDAKRNDARRQDAGGADAGAAGGNGKANKPKAAGDDRAKPGTARDKTRLRRPPSR